MDLGTYRHGETEQIRIADLLRLLPTGRESILEIGARDGYHTRRLTTRFPSVTALDLEQPSFSIDGATMVRGDVTALEFPDNAFDVVLCAEVLEHVPALEKAAHEISRVARHAALIGVPYRQDTRVGKSTCHHCKCVNPPYGHINTFDERRLRSLFSELQIAETSFVGSTTERTNRVSSSLMNVAGNPWGTYNQEEPCVRCGHHMRPPKERTAIGLLASAAGKRIERIQQLFARPRPAWIHVLFNKSS